MADHVDRFDTLDRIVHWTLAVSFLLLVLSGLGLYAPAFAGFFDLFGGAGQAIRTHKVAGVIFLVCALLLFLRHLGETCRFDADDRRWLARLGGYLSRNPEEIPQGKFNAGQKLFGIFSFVAALIMGITGFLIWEPTAFAREATRLSLMVHGLFFVLWMLGMVVHVYLATIGNPGTLEGMLHGRVSAAWARKHAGKWFERVTGNR